MKHTILAAVAAIAMAGAANAATLSGLFSVTAVNVTNLNSAQSEATKSNFDAAVAGTLGGVSSVYVQDTFTWDGALDFRVGQPQTAAYTVDQWLLTGSGTAAGVDATLGGSQLSFPNVNDGDATTTFFLFTLLSPLGATDFNVTHDDGIAIFDDGILRGGNVGPTSETTTSVMGFDGGEFSLLYVATNGNPSILEVDATPVPLPASALLLIGGLGGLAAMRKLRKS